MSEDVDVIAARYSNTQRIWRICFAVLLLTTFLAVVLVLTRSNRQAADARQGEQEQRLRADSATKDVTQVGADVLTQIQNLDQQAAELTSPNDPTSYVWNGGLNASAAVVRGLNPQVLALINTRRFLIGSLTEPIIASSPNLKSYLCGHRWFVIGMSKQLTDPSAWLKSKVATDPRYSTTAWGSGPVHPTQSGLIVGWFLTPSAADALKRELSKAGASGPFRKSWDFSSDPHFCDTEGGVARLN